MVSINDPLAEFGIFNWCLGYRNVADDEKKALDDVSGVQQEALQNVGDAKGPLALVPYQPMEPNLENVVMAVPISIHGPQERPSAKASDSNQTECLEKVSMSKPFNITLPENSLRFCSEMDELITQRRDSLMSRRQSQFWRSFPARLENWRAEKYRRPREQTIDYFYHHPGTRKLRSEPEVKFFIKYGFLPKKQEGVQKEKSRGKTSLENPVTFLSKSEKSLLSQCNKADDLDTPVAVDKAIEEQLIWVRANFADPPTGNRKEANDASPNPGISGFESEKKKQRGVKRKRSTGKPYLEDPEAFMSEKSFISQCNKSEDMAMVDKAAEEPNLGKKNAAVDKAAEPPDSGKKNAAVDKAAEDADSSKKNAALPPAGNGETSMGNPIPNVELHEEEQAPAPAQDRLFRRYQEDNIIVLEPIVSGFEATEWILDDD